MLRQWCRWGGTDGLWPRRRRGDPLEHLHPFPSLSAPPVPQTPKARNEGELGGAPFLQGDSHSFQLALKGKSFSLSNPGAPPMANPLTCALLNSKTEIPCRLPPPPPFRYTLTYPIFISLPSGFFSTGEKRVATEGGPGSLEAGGPGRAVGADWEGLISEGISSPMSLAAPPGPSGFPSEF